MESTATIGEIELSSRQRDVLDLVAQRLTVKEIADRLGISDTRVSQHIRNLKTKFGEETLSGLVAAYRLNEPNAACPFIVAEGAKNQLPPWGEIGSGDVRNEAKVIPFSDAQAYMPGGYWRGQSEPRVVPEVLDGPNGQLFRALAMIGILVGLLAAVLVSVSAMDTLSRLFAE